MLCQGISCKDQRDFQINVMYILQRMTPVITMPLGIAVSANPGSTSFKSCSNKANTVTFTGASDGSRGGVAGVATPPLIFKKRSVTSVAVVISTVSTVSEQERNGQGRRDVEVDPRPSGYMQLDAYHVRRGFVQKTANKVVYNDGKVFFSLIHFWTLLPWWIFYTSADILLFVLLSTDTCPRQVHHNVITSFSQYLWSSSVSLALHFSF